MLSALSSSVTAAQSDDSWKRSPEATLGPVAAALSGPSGSSPCYFC